MLNPSLGMLCLVALGSLIGTMLGKYLFDKTQFKNYEKLIAIRAALVWLFSRDDIRISQHDNGTWEVAVLGKDHSLVSAAFNINDAIVNAKGAYEQYTEGKANEYEEKTKATSATSKKS